MLVKNRLKQIEKKKKVGNRFITITITITHLDITLDELNQSGTTEEYLVSHNSKSHRFTEAGVEKNWIPDNRWKDYIQENDEDVNLCRIYGYPKQKATISNQGVITYLKTRYNVEDKTLWSRQNSTKIAISLIDGETPYLAIFKEGVFIGEAKKQEAPKFSEKITQKTKAKVEKIHTDNENLELHQ